MNAGFRDRSDGEPGTDRRPGAGEPPGDPSPFADLYDRAVEELLEVAVTEAWTDTSAGRTHVLTAGDPASPPVLILQGGNVTNPVTLAWFQGLADDYYLVAPDTPGQPGKSAPDDPDAYGPWVVDVVDGLEIDRAAVVGASHGGGALLEAAAHAPDRIAAAALVAPAGFGTPVSFALARIVVPSLGYRVVGHSGLLTRALAPMFTAPVADVEAVTVETIGRALRTGDLSAEFPGPGDLDALATFEAPTLVVLGESDPFFPEARTRRRAERFLPSLVETITLAGERHFLSPDGQARATAEIRAFLAAQDLPDPE